MKQFSPILFIALLLLQGTTVFADSISVSASVDRKVVSVGDAIQLTVAIEGAHSVGAPDLPDIDGFQAQYVGPSTQVSIVNGQMSASVSHIYSLVALKVGKYTINPISVSYKGKTYQTKPITVEVVKGAAPQSRGQEGAPQADELKDYIYLTLTAEKERVYLNEELPITIRLYSRRLDVRDIEYPTFSSNSFSVRKFTKPVQTQEAVDGVLFDVIKFQTVVYPVSTGRLTLGPAQLKCSLVTKNRSRKRRSLFDDDFFNDSIFDDFFGQYQKRPIELKSEPLEIIAEDFPLQGKPQDFSGAVGQFALQVEAKPTEVKVGEPITLTMKVTGAGNIETVSLPKLSGLDKFKTYEPQIKTDESGKSFEQVLIPKDESIKAIPEVRFSFFDPEDEKYHTIKKGPIPILVQAMPAEEKLKIVDLPEVTKRVKPEKLGRDILYIKDSIGSVKKGNSYLYKNSVFLFAQIIPLLALFGALIYQKRKDKLANDIGYVRQKQAPRKAKKGLVLAEKFAQEGKSGEFCNVIFKTMQEYLGGKFALPSAGITSEIVNELRKRGIKEEALEKLQSFFESCDSVRFAPAEISQGEMQRLLALTEETMKLLDT